MIIIGYQGIGKSALAGKNNCIDLESSAFWVDGNRDYNWYKAYCQIALHLHKQGYTVLTSSHKVVREYFKTIMTPEDRKATFVCAPDVWLKNAWINKLEERYRETQLDKDLKAWKNAEHCFADNITELLHSGFKTIVLDTMHYNLSDEIEQAKERI
ncbi:MAG: hypothetical protein IIX87_02275 [Firmicutes bacterium]|nr:hypothetical protein [Bacillota bacterium]